MIQQQIDLKIAAVIMHNIVPDPVNSGRRFTGAAMHVKSTLRL